MRGLTTDRGLLLRVEKGASLLDAIADLARRQRLGSAALSGIGALDEVELGYFHLAEQRYDRHRLDGEYELLHLGGNLSWRDGEPVVHLHAVLGDAALRCLGGHLFAARVAVTAEILLTPLGPRVERAHDAETGLALLDLPPI